MDHTDIAFFLRTFHGGGAERVTLRLARELAHEGYAITVIAVDGTRQADDWVPESVQVVDLGAKSLGRAIVPLARWLRRHSPGVLISGVSAANVVALLAQKLSRTRVPVVVTEHNTQSIQRADAKAFMRRWGTPALMRRLYPAAAGIVAVSDGVADDLAGYLGLARHAVTAIPNPVLDDALVRASAEQIPDEWSTWLAGAPLIVSAGRLVPHKDHALLLAAFAHVLAQRPEVRLAILGEGEMRAAIRDALQEREIEHAVALIGFQRNPYAWFSRADVLALTSRYEGLPTILIEALACGARVVSTDCPSGPRQILEEGRLGRLVRVGDVDGFSHALLESLDEGRWQRPPHESLKAYRPEAVMASYMRLIDPLLAAQSTVRQPRDAP